MSVVVNGSDFVLRMDTVLKNMKKTRNDMCRDTGLKQNTISAWSTRNSIPPLDSALEIAHYLSVDIEWLATGTTESQPAPELAQLFRDIAELDAEGIDTIKAVVEVQKKYRK